jgi:hypothetical protein
MTDAMSLLGTSRHFVALRICLLSGHSGLWRPSARQIYGFTPDAAKRFALPDRRRPPPRHKADSERFGYPFDLQVLVRLDKM